MAAAIGQGIFSVGWGCKSGDFFVRINRAKVVDHGVVFVLGNFAFLQVSDGLLQFVGAFKSIRANIGYAARSGVLLFAAAKARCNYFTGYDAKTNIKLGCISNRVFYGV